MAPETSVHLEAGKQVVFRLATVVEETGKIKIKKEDWKTFAGAASKVYRGKSVAVISTIGGAEEYRMQLLSLLIELATEKSEEKMAQGDGQKDGTGALTFARNGVYAIIPNCTVKTSMKSGSGVMERKSVGLIFLHSAYVGQNHGLHKQLTKFSVTVSAYVTFLVTFTGDDEDIVTNMKQSLHEYNFEDMKKKVGPSTAIFVHKPDDDACFAGFEIASQFLRQYYDSTKSGPISKKIWETACSLRDATVSLRCALTEDLIPSSTENRRNHELHAFLAKIFDRFDSLRLITGDVSDNLKIAFRNAMDQAHLETDDSDEVHDDVGHGEERMLRSGNTCLSVDKCDKGDKKYEVPASSATPVAPLHKQSKEPKDDGADTDTKVEEKDRRDPLSTDVEMIDNKSEVKEKTGKVTSKTHHSLPSEKPLEKKYECDQSGDDGTCVDGGCAGEVKTFKDPLRSCEYGEKTDSGAEDIELSPKLAQVSNQKNEASGTDKKEMPEDNVRGRSESRDTQQNYNKHRHRSPEPAKFVSLKGSDGEKYHETKVVNERVTGGCSPRYSSDGAAFPSSGSPTPMVSKSDAYAPDPPPTTSPQLEKSEILNLIAAGGIVGLEIAEAQLQARFLQTVALFPAYAMNPELMETQIEQAVGQWTDANTGLLAEKDVKKLQTTFKSMQHTLNNIVNYFKEYRKLFEKYVLQSPDGIWTDLTDASSKVESKLPYPDLQVVPKQKKMVEKAIDASIDRMWTEQKRRQEQAVEVEEVVAKMAKDHALDTLNSIMKQILAHGMYSYTTMDRICQELDSVLLASLNQKDTFIKARCYEKEEQSFRDSIIASVKEAKRINQLKSEKYIMDTKAERKRGLRSKTSSGEGHVSNLNTAHLAGHIAGNHGENHPQSPKHDPTTPSLLLRREGSNSYLSEATPMSSVVESQSPPVPETMETDANDLEELANAVRVLETILPRAKGAVANKARAKVAEAQQLLADAKGSRYKIKPLVHSLQWCIEKLKPASNA